MGVNKNIKKSINSQVLYAKELLNKSGLVSPTLRLLIEATIEFGDEKLISEITGYLKSYIFEKDTAYKEFKIRATENFKTIIQHKVYR